MNATRSAKLDQILKTLQDRNCSKCKKPFRVLPKSKQEFCSRTCAGLPPLTIIRNQFEKRKDDPVIDVKYVEKYH